MNNFQTGSDVVMDGVSGLSLGELSTTMATARANSNNNIHHHFSQQINSLPREGSMPPTSNELPREESLSFGFSTTVPTSSSQQFQQQQGGGGVANPNPSMRNMSLGEPEFFFAASNNQSLQAQANAHVNATNLPTMDPALASFSHDPIQASSSFGLPSMSNSSLFLSSKGMLPSSASIAQQGGSAAFAYMPSSNQQQQPPQASYNAQYSLAQLASSSSNNNAAATGGGGSSSRIGGGSQVAYPFASHHPAFGANHSLASAPFLQGMSQLSTHTQNLSHATLIFPQANMSYEQQQQQQQPPSLGMLVDTVTRVESHFPLPPMASTSGGTLSLFGKRNAKPRSSAAATTNSVPKRNRLATPCSSSDPQQLEEGGMGEEKKGQWTSEEDAELKLLVEAATARGQNILDIPFDDIKLRIPGRTLKQVRERWRSNLDPSIVKGEWSLEEDLTILRMRDEQNLGWAVIARALRGRTEHSVKTRHRSMQRAQRRPWSEKEDRIIIENALPNARDVLDETFVLISHQLKNRDAVSVKLRWMELGRQFSQQQPQ